VSVQSLNPSPVEIIRDLRVDDLAAFNNDHGKEERGCGR